MWGGGEGGILIFSAHTFLLSNRRNSWQQFLVFNIHNDFNFVILEAALSMAI